MQRDAVELMKKLFRSWVNWVIILIGAPLMVVLPRLISGTPMNGKAWVLLAISPLCAFAVFGLSGARSVPFRKIDERLSMKGREEGGKSK